MSRRSRSGAVVDAVDAPALGSTPRRDDAKRTITRTTITPAPGTGGPVDDAESGARTRRPLLRRSGSTGAHGRLSAAREPFPGPNILRAIISAMLSALCLLTVGGAILMLLLWQQNRAAGVLATQLERTWDLFDLLRRIERWIAFAVVPVAVAWAVVATLNVRRATGHRRNPIVAGSSILVGIAGIWFVGDQIIGGTDDWLGKAAGFVLQAVFVAVPLLALERVTQSAEARHGPLRAAALITIAFLAQLQFLGALSTIDQSAGADEWGRLGAYMVIGALLQVLGTLATSEAARSIEEGTQHRYELRNRFGEALLAQAARAS